MRSGRSNSCGVGGLPSCDGCRVGCSAQGWERCTLRAAWTDTRSSCSFEKSVFDEIFTPYRPGYSLLLVSCAKHPVTQDTVEVTDTYSGHIRLTPCIQGAQEPVVLDVSGDGNTVACPLGGGRTVVIKASKKLEIVPENDHVRRSGDGSPVMITAEIP
jgi:hypothetical protein